MGCICAKTSIHLTVTEKNGRVYGQEFKATYQGLSRWKVSRFRYERFDGSRDYLWTDVATSFIFADKNNPPNYEKMKKVFLDIPSV